MELVPSTAEILNDNRIHRRKRRNGAPCSKCLFAVTPEEFSTCGVKTGHLSKLFTFLLTSHDSLTQEFGKRVVLHERLILRVAVPCFPYKLPLGESLQGALFPLQSRCGPVHRRQHSEGAGGAKIRPVANLTRKNGTTRGVISPTDPAYAQGMPGRRAPPRVGTPQLLRPSLLGATPGPAPAIAPRRGCVEGVLRSCHSSL